MAARQAGEQPARRRPRTRTLILIPVDLDAFCSGIHLIEHPVGHERIVNDNIGGPEAVNGPKREQISGAGAGSHEGDAARQ